MTFTLHSPDDRFLTSLAARFNKPGVKGIALAGSHARGENGPHSDVDLDIFIEPPASESYTLHYLEGRLVSIKTLLLQNELDSLKRPENAIWMVPGFRQMRILVDETGQLAKLKQAALEFSWSHLQPAADEFAVVELMGCAEEAHKIVSGLACDDESKVLYATWGLLKGLSSAVSVQRGLMIDSENRFFDILQESLGRGHPWTRAFRLAFGMDIGNVIIPPYRTRGKAALELYVQTAQILNGIITENHREVIMNTLKLIGQA